MSRQYTVVGRWPFPTDMLRRDDAVPASPEDAALIAKLSGEHPPEGHSVGAFHRIELVLGAGMRSPCVERWASFGWRASQMDERWTLDAVPPTLQVQVQALEAGRQQARDVQAVGRALRRPITFQDRVHPWMIECFGEDVANDGVERNHRFLEEALELVQALGCPKGDAHTLVEYVYGRPWGEPRQEVGGVMVTLAALCLANDLDMHHAGDVELDRVWTKIEQIRAKQAGKPKGSALPQAVANADDGGDSLRLGWLLGHPGAEFDHEGDRHWLKFRLSASYAPDGVAGLYMVQGGSQRACIDAAIAGPLKRIS